MNEYQCIVASTEGLYKDKNSKFFSFAIPIFSIEDAKYNLKICKEIHPKANHHCYAYRMALDPNQYRAVDAGEPSYTAGKPILNVLDSKVLHNVIIIVARYFGGTLLGTSGLIHAYTQASEIALRTATFCTKKINVCYFVYVNYDVLTAFQNQTKTLDLRIISGDYEIENVILKVEIARDFEATFKVILNKLAITFAYQYSQ